MSFTKITSADTTNKGVVGLPDEPGLSCTEMQEKFDELALDVIIPKFNGLVDELDAAKSDTDEAISNITTYKEITVATTDWETNSHATYTKKAVKTSEDYGDDYVPISVDLIPADGSAFFSSGENDARDILNPNIDISSTGVTFYAEETPSVALKFRIRGVV